MLETFLPFYCMSFILAGLDCVLAGWGFSQEIPQLLAPENLKILNVQTYEKRNCKAGPVVERSNEYICAGVPGNTSQAGCVVTTKIFCLRCSYLTKSHLICIPNESCHRPEELKGIRPAQYGSTCRLGIHYLVPWIEDLACGIVIQSPSFNEVSYMGRKMVCNWSIHRTHH